MRRATIAILGTVTAGTAALVGAKVLTAPDAAQAHAARLAAENQRYCAQLDRRIEDWESRTRQEHHATEEGDEEQTAIRFGDDFRRAFPQLSGRPWDPRCRPGTPGGAPSAHPSGSGPVATASPTRAGPAPSATVSKPAPTASAPAPSTPAPAPSCTSYAGTPGNISSPGTGTVTVTITVCGGVVTKSSGVLANYNYTGTNDQAVTALNTLAVQYYKTNLGAIKYSGASLTSAAYQASLKSALTKAGM